MESIDDLCLPSSLHGTLEERDGFDASLLDKYHKSVENHFKGDGMVIVGIARGIKGLDRHMLVGYQQSSSFDPTHIKSGTLESTVKEVKILLGMLYCFVLITFDKQFLMQSDIPPLFGPIRQRETILMS